MLQNVKKNYLIEAIARPKSEIFDIVFFVRFFDVPAWCDTEKSTSCGPTYNEFSYMSASLNLMLFSWKPSAI